MYACPRCGDPACDDCTPVVDRPGVTHAAALTSGVLCSAVPHTGGWTVLSTFLWSGVNCDRCLAVRRNGRGSAGVA